MKRYTPRFDREWKEMIALLPKDRQSAMENAIRAYQVDGAEPAGLDGAEAMAFMLIKKIVDRRRRQRQIRLGKKNPAPTLTPTESEPHPDTKETREVQTFSTTPQLHPDSQEPAPTRHTPAKAATARKPASPRRRAISAIDRHARKCRKQPQRPQKANANSLRLGSAKATGSTNKFLF